MMYIGSHVSLKGKEMYLGSVKEALSYGANAFMLYTGAPQNTLRKPIAELKINEALELMKENNILKENVIVHAPYIVNPATSDEEKRLFAIKFLTEEVKRACAMCAGGIILHPGNALHLSKEEAISNTCQVINQMIENTIDNPILIIIELMSGKGTEIGSSFEEIRSIINGIIDQKRIGVCFDTCHANDAGYDIVNDYEQILQNFDQIIGLDKIKVIHLNDSKNMRGSKKDRHENIGKGQIGFETLYKIAHDVRFKSIPKILETPYMNDLPPYKEEILKIKNG